jgi:hypothetical protein
METKVAGPLGEAKTQAHNVTMQWVGVSVPH